MRQEKFTEQAQEALGSSQELAMQFHHSQWDVEHILLALLIQQQGLVGEILKELNVDSTMISDKVEEALDKIPKVPMRRGRFMPRRGSPSCSDSRGGSRPAQG